MHQEGQLHGSATREQIKTGPGQVASGLGAEGMVREYSAVAAQRGTALYPEPLERMLADFGRSMKSSMEALLLSQSNLPAALVEALKAKKAKGEDEEEEDEEESEVVEINASKKAKDFLRKARKLAKDLDVLKADMEDCDTSAERKAARKAIKSLEHDLGAVLGKAQVFAYAASDAELKKSIRLIASKADVEVVQEEEEDEEEEEESKSKKAAAKAAEEAAEATAKAAKEAAEKAKTDDKGHQADRQDPANGNQAAAAKTVDNETLSKLEKALSGMDTLKMEVRQMMDVISGKSKVADLVPDLSKAKVADIDSVTDKIEEMEESGQLTPIEACAARDIASLAKAAAEGTMPASRVRERLEKTSSNVVALFKAVPGIQLAA